MKGPPRRRARELARPQTKRPMWSYAERGVFGGIEHVHAVVRVVLGILDAQQRLEVGTLSQQLRLAFHNDRVSRILGSQYAPRVIGQVQCLARFLAAAEPQ